MSQNETIPLKLKNRLSILNPKQVLSQNTNTPQKSLVIPEMPQSCINRPINFKPENRKLGRKLSRLATTVVSFSPISSIKKNEKERSQLSTPLEFNNSSPKKNPTLKEMLKLLYDNNELCTKIQEKSKNKDKDDLEDSDADVLLAGLEKANNLMPLLQNRNKPIPITSMSVKLQKPLSLNKGKHIHTTPLDSTLTIARVKNALSKYKNTSIAQKILQSRNLKNSLSQSKSHNFTQKIENQNLLSATDSCEQRELYLGRTLYYEQSLRKEIQELLKTVETNYKKYAMRKSIKKHTSATCGLIFSYANLKRMAINTNKNATAQKKAFLDLDSSEINERMVPASLTVEKLLSSNLDIDQIAKSTGITLYDDEQEEEFKMPDFTMQNPKKCSIVEMQKDIIRIRKIQKKREQEAMKKVQENNEWSIKGMLFNNESHRLFGKDNKFVKRSTFSLIRNKL